MENIYCLTCNKPLQDMIFNNEDFWSRMMDVALPLPVLGLLILAFSTSYKNQNLSGGKRSPLITAGTFLGIGLGGFIDGIVLHQLLQWHQMISNVLPPDTLLNKQINTFWDGIFHVFTWAMTVVGVVLLWRLFFKRDLIISSQLFVGALILGWGIFNAFDSIVNHYLLKIHNIRENTENPMLYNHAFFAFALILMLTGWLMIKNVKEKSSD
jgi:uncharacterized membrane protein